MLKTCFPKENVSSILTKKHSKVDPKSKKATHTWDEHVLALLSKSTADIILKDFTPSSQQETLNIFLDDHSRKLQKNTNTDSKTSLVCDENNNILSTENIGLVDTDDTVEEYFKGTNTHREKKIYHEKILQDSFPLLTVFMVERK